MVRKLIDWSVANPLFVLLVTAALLIGGGYALAHVNIEAYPDPAPAIIEVVAQYPGASAEWGVTRCSGERDAIPEEFTR